MTHKLNPITSVMFLYFFFVFFDTIIGCFNLRNQTLQLSVATDVYKAQINFSRALLLKLFISVFLMPLSLSPHAPPHKQLRGLHSPFNFSELMTESTSAPLDGKCCWFTSNINHAFHLRVTPWMHKQARQSAHTNISTYIQLGSVGFIYMHRLHFVWRAASYSFCGSRAYCCQSVVSHELCGGFWFDSHERFLKIRFHIFVIISLWALWVKFHMMQSWRGNMFDARAAVFSLWFFSIQCLYLHVCTLHKYTQKGLLL